MSFCMQVICSVHEHTSILFIDILILLFSVRYFCIMSVNILRRTSFNFTGDKLACLFDENNYFHRIFQFWNNASYLDIVKINILKMAAIQMTAILSWEEIRSNLQ